MSTAEIKSPGNTWMLFEVRLTSASRLTFKCSLGCLFFLRFAFCKSSAKGKKGPKTFRVENIVFAMSLVEIYIDWRADLS